MVADRTPGDFGRRLRDARERRGISLRQIASATKISVSALEALERNDISRLPGGIFSRAFVRSYAIEVGLDPETTIQDFIAQFPPGSVMAGHAAADQVEDHEAVESERRMASTFLRLILISVPLAIAVIYFGTSGRFVRQAPEPERPPAPATEPAPAPVPGPSDAPATSTEPVPAAAAVPPAADHLTVGLTVTRPCWVSLTVDGEKKIERLLQPGDDQTVDVTREMVLTAGDAAAITMTLNGEPSKALGGSGEVVTKRVNRANFKDLLQSR